MTDVLSRLQNAGVLSPLDVQLARTLERLQPGQSDPVLLGAAFASRAIAHGHICADLRELDSRPLVDEAGESIDGVRLPRLFEWVMELGQSSLCGDGSSNSDTTPLVFDGEARLYLTRYWRYQHTLCTALRSRALAQLPLDAEQLGTDVRRLFGRSEDKVPDPRQMLAAVMAAARRLTVISGGPGTGKTTTVVRVLALLVEQALSRGEQTPRIMMLAPTGKAAARLCESVTRSLPDLASSDEVKAALPLEARTLHRALGYQPHTPTRFRHGREDPLPADVVLVDEASMVDLALMAKLVEAVAPDARLILLGDKDQLASVEAGAILGDICNTEGRHAYSAPFGDMLGQVLGPTADTLPVDGPASTGPWDCIVELTHSFRFAADEGIGRFSRALRSGEGSEALAQLQRGDDAVSMVELRDDSELETTLRPAILAEFNAYLSASDPEARLDALGTYRLLSAHRRGAFGTERLNLLIEDILLRAGRIQRDDSGPNYHGRPIMISANDYQLGLYNGDVGVIERDGHRLRAYFRGADGSLRAPLLPSRLPPHETVFAMTVHKSQGSEFEHAVLVLPEARNPVLTKELVYTAITRASKHFTLVESRPGVFEEAVRTPVRRISGLALD
ncbi:MAG: exodeoxyribonuclease V subunit alpha [Pseudomonadaceae bacterium]